MRDIAPTRETQAFRLNGIPFVPHYTNHDIYVSPGDHKTRRTLTEKELLELGAVKERMFLWPREKVEQGESMLDASAITKLAVDVAAQQQQVAVV